MHWRDCGRDVSIPETRHVNSLLVPVRTTYPKFNIPHAGSQILVIPWARIKLVARKPNKGIDVNGRMMPNPDTREEGFPIGSGRAESDVKQFKARLAGPGMRWSREGVNRMVAIRSAVLSNSFDALWAVA